MLLRTSLRDIPGADGFAIAIIIAVISIVCMVGASAWQARHPRPVTYARVEPPAPSVKLPDSLPVYRVPTTAFRLDPPAPKVATLSELVRSPWPCPAIRKAVETFGRDAVRGYARAKGYTKKQIDEAMACVPEKRT